MASRRHTWEASQMASPHDTDMGTLIELWRVLGAADVSAEDIKVLSTTKPPDIAAGHRRRDHARSHPARERPHEPGGRQARSSA